MSAQYLIAMMFQLTRNAKRDYLKKAYLRPFKFQLTRNAKRDLVPRASGRWKITFQLTRNAKRDSCFIRTVIISSFPERRAKSLSAASYSAGFAV